MQMIFYHYIVLGIHRNRIAKELPGNKSGSNSDEKEILVIHSPTHCTILNTHYPVQDSGWELLLKVKNPAWV